MAIGRTLADASLLDELVRALEPGVIRSAYQPIVDLSSGEVVAYEALARGPLGSRLERPDNLFAAGRAAGRVADLDWACRGAAVRGALEGGLRPPLTLFLNVDPASLHRPVPPAFKEVWTRAESRLRVVLEITERALTDRPTELLWSVEWARDLGWGIALDDVGADPRSLALLPFLRPDVIKLDMALVGARPTVETAEVVHAVAAEAERTGAIVLAEGVETASGREVAEALRASRAVAEPAPRWVRARPGQAAGLGRAGCLHPLRRPVHPPPGSAGNEARAVRAHEVARAPRLHGRREARRAERVPRRTLLHGLEQ
jgi:EAL domain-containing protein (putative c-di-GMP-specific phosphodiesterase class I)